MHWIRKLPAKRWHFSHTSKSVDVGVFWPGVVGTAVMSVALSLVLLSTYATDTYERILGTHCGSQTHNSVGSLSAMFAQKPNMIFWRLGIILSMPVIFGSSLVTMLMAKKKTLLRKVIIVLATLENLTLAILTVRSIESANAAWLCEMEVSLYELEKHFCSLMFL